LPAFLKIAALHVMKAPGVTAVVAGVDPAFGIDLQTVGVAAPFCEYLIAPRGWMITPDVLAHGLHGLRVLLEKFFLNLRPVVPGWRSALAAGNENGGTDGAALGAVEPAVGPPAQAVGDGVRVLQSEP